MMSRPVKKSFLLNNLLTLLIKDTIIDNKQKLINFLDNIETNKKYYKMGIHKNKKKFKRSRK